MYFVGVDLAGPKNWTDTATAVGLSPDGESLHISEVRAGYSDRELCQKVLELAEQGPVALAIDAPLSYEDGGGLRESDKALRQILQGRRLLGPSIMPPTLYRMVYLTLRGIALTRRLGIAKSRYPITICEVHPGATLAHMLSTCPLAKGDWTQYKNDRDVLYHLYDHVNTGVFGEWALDARQSSHTFDASIACFAAFQCAHGRSFFVHRSNNEAHPYPFVC